MIRWVRSPKQIMSDGTEVIRYASVDTPVYIESRKRQIPRKNGKGGTWPHLTYVVLFRGVEITERSTLADAKECAEDLEDLANK